jgi:hypothetical protein
MNDYRQKAEQHRPRTSAEIAEAAKTLTREFGVATAAHVLQLDPLEVRRLIGRSRAGYGPSPESQDQGR